MNELEKTLQKILEKSIELAEKTGEFVISEGTELLQEFYLWHTLTAILGIVLAFFILLIGYIIIKIIGKNSEYEDDYGIDSKKYLGFHFGTDQLIFAGIVTAITFIIFGIVFCVNLYDLIFVLAAPKLYLLEYFL